MAFFFLLNIGLFTFKGTIFDIVRSWNKLLSLKHIFYKSGKVLLSPELAWLGFNEHFSVFTVREHPLVNM